MSTYHGKYRGTVVNNIDPKQQGRLQAMVPDVLGSMPSSWAMACVPFAGTQAGLWSVPAIGSGVWIEFEQGDPDFPVWTGGWWGSPADPPALALAVPPVVSHVVVQTTGQNTLSISDAPGPAGGLLLKSMTGALIMINETGITLSNGQGATILMTGPSVIINGGALAVT
jgi:uncharacterized protein involved in type VI secretion and phage assembly